jgi:heme exporter protein D
MNWSEFFAMGGYALYVWGSYGLAAVILILNVVQPLRRAKLVRAQLREFYRLKGQSQ